MKSESRSLPRSDQARPRRTTKGQSLDRTAAGVAFSSPEHGINGSRGEVAKKRPSSSVDLENVLHFSQQLYAHALTLQEVIRNEGQVTYEVLKPGYDRQAAQQFEVFYDNFKQPSGFRKRSAASRVR